jgi:hypothetical protein
MDGRLYVGGKWSGVGLNEMNWNRSSVVFRLNFLDFSALILSWISHSPNLICSPLSGLSQGERTSDDLEFSHFQPHETGNSTELVLDPGTSVERTNQIFLVPEDFHQPGHRSERHLILPVGLTFIHIESCSTEIWSSSTLTTSQHPILNLPCRLHVR